MKNKLLEILGIEKIINSLQNLLEIRIAIIRSEMEEKVAQSIAKALPLLFIMLSVFLFFLFGSITLGLYLSIATGSTIMGFGIITAFYLVLALLFYLIRKNKTYIENFYKQIKRRL